MFYSTRQINFKTLQFTHAQKTDTLYCRHYKLEFFLHGSCGWQITAPWPLSQQAGETLVIMH